MVELGLVCGDQDRHLFALADVGTLRLERTLWRAATAEAGGSRWSFGRRGIVRRVSVATHRDGVEDGKFEPARGFRRGGTIHWGGRSYELSSRGSWRGQRFVLAEAGAELAVLDGRSSDRRPVTVAVPDPDALDSGLLLFAAFVVRGLTLDAWSAVAAGSAAST